MSAQDAAGGAEVPFGPIQMLVLEFDRTRFDGRSCPSWSA